jgi:hypothetical protein
MKNPLVGSGAVTTRDRLIDEAVRVSFVIQMHHSPDLRAVLTISLG